jgi:hypothetical protein
MPYHAAVVVEKSYETSQNKKRASNLDALCDLAGIRTRDPLIKSQMLYRLSYEINAL